MGKRPRFSRWRRNPGLYRFGDQKPPDPDQDLQRLSLYVPWSALDQAEAQAARLGYASSQDYCTELLRKALEAEAVREQVAEVEARRGPLEGLHEIASDPEILAELSGVSPGPRVRPDRDADHATSGGGPSALESLSPPKQALPPGPEEARPWVDPDEPPAVRITPIPAETRPAGAPAMSSAAWVVLRHAGHAEPDPYGFLACLRRGEPVPPGEVADLAQALHQLEGKYRERSAMDRRLIFALHRLAFESQVLHTDAWPGAFDAWTVDVLRAVQEAVERILSGQDIRYFERDAGVAPLESAPPPNPEVRP